MIKGLLIERFQSIVGPCRLGLKELTFLYGPNSAGKSSVLDLLKLFQDIASLKMGSLNFNGAPIRKGTRESLAVGIEFTFDSSNRLDESDAHRLSRYEDGIYQSNFDDKKFFKALKDKLICIKIIAGGTPADDDCLEIHIDDRLFLKISSEPTWFNPSLEIIEFGEALDGSDPVYGYVLVNKTIAGYEHLDLWSPMLLGNKRLDLEIFKFFESETEDKIEVRGLDFHLLTSSIDLFGGRGRLLVPHLSNGAHLGEWSRESFFEFFNDFYQPLPPDDMASRKEGYSKWLGLISEDTKKRSASINSSLWSWSDRLSLLLEAFLLRLSAEMSFTLVPGERKIIDSSCPLLYGGLEDASCDSNALKYHESLATYFSKNIQATQGHETVERSEFVNEALEGLMPSLGKYKLLPLISKAEPVKSSWPLGTDLETNFTDGDGSFWRQGYALYPYLSSDNLPGTAINFKDIGSGVSFVFPILTSIDVGALVIIEQPELHLHPRAQCEIGDVFISGINHKRNMIVESHSEHILLRISRRIRETSRGQLGNPILKLKPNQVVIHYFRPNGDGTTTIFPIRFDKEGDFLDLWPDGFFSERESEIFDE